MLQRLSSNLVKHKGQILSNLLDNIKEENMVTPEQFYAEHAGETDWAVMINAAMLYAKEHGKAVLLANTYNIRTTIFHPQGVNLLCMGKIVASATGSYRYTTFAGNTENAAYIVASQDGKFDDTRGTHIHGLYITYTHRDGEVGYADPHIDAEGIVFTDTASVWVSCLRVLGFRETGINVGGISGRGYEINITDAVAWIYSWVDSEKPGFVCNVTDSNFTNIVTVSYGIGVHSKKGGGNTYTNVHPWGYPYTETNQYPNRQTKIHFLCDGGGVLFNHPYIDTLTKVNPNAPASRANGGYGFYFTNWRNRVRDCEVLVHRQEISDQMAVAYFEDGVKRNIVEVSNINDTSRLVKGCFAYSETNTSAIFVNECRLPEYQSVPLEGGINFNATGVTSKGEYTIRRSGDYVDVHILVDVSSVSNPSGGVTLQLPRGLSCRYGVTVEPIWCTCFGNINQANTGVIAVVSGNTVDFRYTLPSGSRTTILAAGVSTGRLEIHFHGRISN